MKKKLIKVKLFLVTNFKKQFKLVNKQIGIHLQFKVLMYKNSSKKSLTYNFSKIL